MNKTKKGIALQQAFPAVLIVLLLGVLVIVAIVMFNSLALSSPLQTVSIVNESGWINESAYTNSSYGAICNIQPPASFTAINGTDGGTISPGNYTQTGFSITNATSRVWPTALFSFTYRWGGQACSSSQNMTTQFATYVALVGLVGVIIFLGIVIGTLIVSFMTSKRGV